MNNRITLRTTFHMHAGRSGRKHLERGEAYTSNVYPGRIPLVSKLMALAIRFEGLVCEKLVKNQADLARLGYVSRARVTQIMNLLQLAPDIQEVIFFLPLVVSGRDPIILGHLHLICVTLDWRQQRELWNALLSSRE
jgi:hypothetical protein